MKILSLFDGISTGRLALQRAGIQVDKYYAFEIDKHAIQISKNNFNDITHMGDITKWADSKIMMGGIDLLLAGFPCQAYSIAGNRLALDDLRGKLIYDMLEVIEFYHPKHLLLENVKGFLSSNKGAVNDMLLVRLKDMGYDIRYKVANSSLISAQSRERVYWTTWDWDLPKDKGIILSSILEDGYVDRDKSYCIDANYWKGGNYKSYFGKGRRQLVFDQPVQVGVADLNGHDILKRVYSRDGKSPTLNTMGGGNREPKVDIDGITWRKLTPLECERLQTLPDNYTAGVANTNRYRCIGNGWCTDMIVHILKEMK